ncbi:MAG: type II secretion system F family protein [Candidatus Nanohaloarchaea archaeon]|nr:type II secretion system F family protein [Candidatus Nanohaloarchaea archaeon]
MGLKKWYLSKAEDWFSRYALMIKEYFQDTKIDLQKADINYTLTQYLSLAMMSAVSIFMLSTPLMSMFIGFMQKSIAGVIAGVIAGFFIGVVLSVATFGGFYLYPSVEVARRKEDINHNLPFATLYLSTVASSGNPPAAMFKLLGNFEEYGEVSKEAAKIAGDVYNFGADVEEALNSAAERTPSDKFKNFLWGLNSVVTTGGDLKAYLSEKASEFMRDYRRELDKFTDLLSLLVEMYITIVIVGSVFLIILSTIMSALGGGQAVVLGLQTATIFLLLPMASIMFIIIVKGASPLE